MSLKPKNHAEVVALFRVGILGALLSKDLSRGDLKQGLKELSEQRFRPPDADTTRTYGVPTLERWYYAYRHGGLEALCPKPRKDRGHLKDLTQEQHELLVEIRKEYPSAPVPLIVRTLVAEGRLEERSGLETGVRRLYADLGLSRTAVENRGQKTRLRWEAAAPNALWHADVCHGPTLCSGGPVSLRVHAILDDASRYIVGLCAFCTEREEDMLDLWVRALRRFGRPDALYLDNGPTYRGDALRIACARLGITLLHAKPYDPQARGKMERFWRTLRENCLSYLGSCASLHDVNVRLLSFLDQHYHKAPHAALLGRSPLCVYGQSERPLCPLEEQDLREALTVSKKRRVKKDTTLCLDGRLYELDQGFLAGQVVTVCYSLYDGKEAMPYVEHKGRRYALHLCDPVHNATRKRPPRRPTKEQTASAKVPFDPPGALLARAVGRTKPHKEGK